MENSENINTTSMPGNPDCPICHGIGFVRQDMPIDHPKFGQMQICECRKSEIEALQSEHLYNLSNIDAFKEMTFKSFKISGRDSKRDIAKSQESAFNTAINFSKEPEGWLLLTGKYGCGKTHLAAAIANKIIEQNIPTLFLTVPDLLDWLRYSFRAQKRIF